MRRLLVGLLCLALLAGCSDDSTNDEQADAGDTGDTSAADTDDPDTADSDGGDDADTGPTSCDYQSECSAGQFCHDGTCEAAPECDGRSNWQNCVDAFQAIEDGLGRRALCEVDYCRLACITDAHCPDGQLCSDHGHCIDFTGDVTGEHPGGTSREPLRAGVSNVLMRFPIGLSQGGYGSRASTDDGRYVESLSATHGQMHGLFARAFVLDNGERQMMFIRLPIIFPTKAIHERVARRLQEETGRDWRDSLIISGTHTHSGPTRYWHLPRASNDEVLTPLGAFGTDEFSQQVFDWVVDSTYDAAEQALADMAPARFGWEIVEAYDTDDAISSDRWGETPPFDDNRLLLFRIEDLDGNPRAVMFSLGTHGTVHENVYFTGDVLSGMERELEARLGRDYDRFVPVLYFNQNGGTMSPRGGRWNHGELQRYEAIGHHFADRAYTELEEMDTTRDIALDGVTHRFPMTYEILGYEPGEWVANLGGTINDQYDYGGIQCMGSRGDDDYATHAEPGDVNCVPVHFLGFHTPITIFARSQITALEIDGLNVVTMPGEVSMEVAWQVLRDARDAWGIDPMSSWVWGYAQDHQFYFTPTNLRGELPPFPGISTPMAPDDYPDYAFSYFQAGYEAGLNVWGWKMGDFMVERAVEAIGLVRDEQVDLELPQPFPVEYSRIDEEPFPVEPSTQSRVGTVTSQPPSTVSRLTPIELSWIGGDPGAEMPQSPLVTLERENGQGTFEPVTLPSTRTYTNREPTMLTRLRKDSDDWEWVIHWEELHDFPAGTYRFRVDGHHFDASSERVAYEVMSDPFELQPTQDVVVEVSNQNGDITGRLGYPPSSALSFAGTADDPGRVTGNYRMRHPHVPTGEPRPLIAGDDVDPADVTIEIRSGNSVVATVDSADLTLTTQDESVGGSGGVPQTDDVPVTRFSAPVPASVASGDYEVEVRVEDTHGNTGSHTTTLSL